MSRVSIKPIIIPKGVEVSVKDRKVSVKGPKGSLDMDLYPSVDLNLSKGESSEPDTVSCVLNDAAADATGRAMMGTTRALVTNMLQGVLNGFEKKLELVGVGYRAQASGQKIQLNLGFSHPVDFSLPEGVTAETPSNTTIVIKSIDKQKVGQVAADIRAYRPPEPYKGKGIKYEGEKIIRKETKKK